MLAKISFIKYVLHLKRAFQHNIKKNSETVLTPKTRTHQSKFSSITDSCPEEYKLRWLNVRSTPKTTTRENFKKSLLAILNRPQSFIYLSISTDFENDNRKIS